MNFNDIETTVQNDIIEFLNDHIVAAVDIIREDKCLLPMLIIKGDTDESNQLFSLQARDGNTDIDKAYAHVIQKLKSICFTYALFSYSTQIVLNSGEITDALKTCIFAKNGLEVDFYTPFAFRENEENEIVIEETFLTEVTENIFA